MNKSNNSENINDLRELACYIAELDLCEFGFNVLNQQSVMLDFKDDYFWWRQANNIDRINGSMLEFPDLDLIKRKLKEIGVKSLKREVLEEAIKLLSLENCFNPVWKILEKFPKWDKVKRVETVFIDYFGAKDTPYVREAAKLFFRALISCSNMGYPMLEPDFRNWQYLLVLVGEKGLGKSDFFKNIAGNHYLLKRRAENFTSTLFYGEILSGYYGTWICEVGNLAEILKKKNELFSEFIRRNSFIVMKENNKFSEDEIIENTIDENFDEAKIKEIERKNLFVGTLDPKKNFKEICLVNSNYYYLPIYCHKKLDVKRFMQNLKQIIAEAIFLDNEVSKQVNISRDYYDFNFSEEVNTQRLKEIDTFYKVRCEISNNLELCPHKWDKHKFEELMQEASKYIEFYK